jgi:dihydrofolate reductase
VPGAAVYPAAGGHKLKFGDFHNSASERGPVVTMIAALSRDGFISRGTGVPWHLPEDVRQFRAYCEGKWLLAGRKTFEEMTGWFRMGHTPVVVTRQKGYRVANGHAAADVEEAVAMFRRSGTEELVVIGGGEVYAAAMPYAGALRLTVVETDLGAGVAFPAVNMEQWREVSCHRHPADAHHAQAFSLRLLLRAEEAPPAVDNPGAAA